MTTSIYSPGSNIFGRVPSAQLSLLSANIPLLAASIEDDGGAVMSVERVTEDADEEFETNTLRCRLLFNSNEDVRILRNVIRHTETEALDLLEKRSDHLDRSSFPWVVTYPHLQLQVQWVPKHSKQDDPPRDVLLDEVAIKIPFPTSDQVQPANQMVYVKLFNPTTRFTWWYRIRLDSTVCSPSSSRSGSDLLNRRELQKRWDALARTVRSSVSI